MNIVYVDHNDVEIGAAPIGDVYKQGLIARIARIFLKNKRGELLLQKRSDHHVSRPSKWDQAAAGHVDENELTPIPRTVSYKKRWGLKELH
jgi:isopentenyldiphosphate isomerase